MVGFSVATHKWLFVVAIVVTHASGGIYTLVIEVPTRLSIEVGALGPVAFDAGFYAYVGSALGQGGFTRIDRHRELARGDRDVRHWHADYLLGAEGVDIADVERSTGFDQECALAAAIGGDAVPGFGCSDCDCDSHLFHRPGRETMVGAVRAAHRDMQNPNRGDRV